MLLTQGSNIQTWFTGGPDSVQAARCWLLAVLPTVPEEERDTLRLALSELATNAVRYTGGAPYAVYAELLTGRSVRVAVMDSGTPDSSPTVGELREELPEDIAEGGRGLAVVQALTDRMGSEITSEGFRRVWCELAWSEKSPLPRRSGRTAGALP